MIVLDASAAIDHLLHRDSYERIAARLSVSGETLHVPHVLDLEVANALRRLSLRGSISAERAQEALHEYALYPVERYPMLALLDRVWELRSNMSAFDAAYVALAEVLDAPLITTDARLARAPGHQATIELLA